LQLPSQSKLDITSHWRGKYIFGVMSQGNLKVMDVYRSGLDNGVKIIIYLQHSLTTNYRLEIGKLARLEMFIAVNASMLIKIGVILTCSCSSGIVMEALRKGFIINDC